MILDNNSRLKYYISDTSPLSRLKRPGRYKGYGGRFIHALPELSSIDREGSHQLAQRIGNNKGSYMLSYIYSVAKEFEIEHGYSPNCIYMNYAHLECLKQQLDDPNDFNSILVFLGMELILAQAADSSEKILPRGWIVGSWTQPA